MSWVRLLLAVALAAGCVASSADAASGPTKTSWARAADSVCGAGNAEVRNEPKPTTTALLIADLHATYLIGVKGVRRLSTIPPPADETATIARMLGIARTENKITQGQLIRALKRGQTALVSSLSTKVTKLGDDYNTLATELGALVCAENPSPGG